MSSEVTVDWKTENGNEKAGTDYVVGAGTVRFAPGRAAKTVNITVLVDDDYEEEVETMILRLSNATGATIARGIGAELILPLDEQDGLVFGSGWHHDESGN